MKRIFVLVGICAVMLFVATVGAAYLVHPALKKSAPEVTSSRTARQVALACTSDTETRFHAHPNLEIVADGKVVIIPPDIGVRPECMNALHTHDMTGTIHVESPERKEFTLGDFFAVWQQPFNEKEVLTYKTDSTHRITVTVNGSEVSTFENTVIKDTDSIVITYK